MSFLRKTLYCGVCRSPIVPSQDSCFRKVDGIVRLVHRACRPKEES